MKYTRGTLYVISTNTYFNQNIFKIGFTKCITKRLKQFNNTRTTEDQYFLCFKHDTINYKKLEILVHEALDPYRLHNELFQCPLSAIIDVIKNITTSGFFNHKDVVFDNASTHNLLWAKDKWLMTFEDELQVFMNNDKLIEYIKDWLKPYDTLNLYRFISDEYYESLLHFLRMHFTETFSSKKHPHMEMLSDLFVDLSIEPKNRDDIYLHIQELKIV